jgi:hypothetical protein
MAQCQDGIKQEGVRGAQQLVLQLDQFQDERQLTAEEYQLRMDAKNKILAVAAVRKIRLRQCSRLTWIKVEDANTKLFHLRMNTRRRRNHIPVLKHNGVTCITQEVKSVALHNFFTRQFANTTPREHTLNWEMLQPMSHDLQELEMNITEEEIKQAVMQSALEKVPGPDGFIGDFFKNCWEIIKQDLVAAIQEIFALRANCWNLLNSANVVLLEMEEGVEFIGDYRPISIMHSVAKLPAKTLANRLAPHLDKFVSHSQSAFIKGRSIHDNF